MGHIVGTQLGQATFAATTMAVTSGIKFLLNNKIIQVGRIDGIMRSGKQLKGYPGIRYQNRITGKMRSVELHSSHNGHGIHLQRNTWWLNKAGYEGQY